MAPTHKDGSAKAKFLSDFGFRLDASDVLLATLTLHARANEVLRLQTSPHGVKNVIEGPMPTPDGRAPVVRTVWIVNDGEDVPRFVTAFPGRRIRP